MITTVFFDLFETLISEWENGKRKASYSTDKLGLTPEVYSEEWKKRKQLQEVGHYSSYSHALQNMVESRNVQVERELLTYLENERMIGKARSFEKIDRGILSALSSLKRRGLKLGLISNCSYEDITAWQTSALSPFFDDVIFSFKEKLAKPDPKIYLLACQRLSSLPGQSLFIGDGGSNELAGATACGLDVYQAGWFIPADNRDEAFPMLTSPEQIIAVIDHY